MASPAEAVINLNLERNKTESVLKTLTPREEVIKMRFGVRRRQSEHNAGKKSDRASRSPSRNGLRQIDAQALRKCCGIRPVAVSCVRSRSDAPAG